MGIPQYVFTTFHKTTLPFEKVKELIFRINETSDF